MEQFLVTPCIPVGRRNAVAEIYRWRQDEIVLGYTAAAADAAVFIVYSTKIDSTWSVTDLINSGAERSVSGLQKLRLA